MPTQVERRIVRLLVYGGCILHVLFDTAGVYKQSYLDLLEPKTTKTSRTVEVHNETNVVLEEVQQLLRGLTTAGISGSSRSANSTVEMHNKTNALLEELQEIIRGLTPAGASGSSRWPEGPSAAPSSSPSASPSSSPSVSLTANHKRSNNISQAGRESKKNKMSSESQQVDDACPEYTAACLMIKEENHRLIEWLAYHYHVAGLRRVIVLNSVGAETTPRPILDRWEGNMNITIWNEKGISDMTNIMTANSRKAYLRNQQTFEAECYSTLKQEGWNLAFSIDPDEYLMINHLIRKEGEKLNSVNVYNQINVPTQKEPCSVIKFLHRIQPYRNANSTEYMFSDSPCLQFSRNQFTNKESANAVSTTLRAQEKMLHKLMDTTRMNTLRWHYRNGSPIGKGMAELSRLAPAHYRYFHSIHYPVGMAASGSGKPFDVCSKEKVWRGGHESPIVINHYPSTWEEMMFRRNQSMFMNGPNTNATQYLVERYEKESKTKGDAEYGIEDWVLGFVEAFGDEQAGRLLRDVGNPHKAAEGAAIIWGEQVATE